MTSWRRLTILFLIVSFTVLSRQNCANYFDMTEWTGKNLTFTFQLANTKNPADLIKCTLKDACEKTKWQGLCAIQKYCFNGTIDEKNWTCRGSTSQNISFYHLMCLAALSLDKSIAPEGCKYENVCSLYHHISPDRIPTTASTTVLPTMTATETVLSLNTTPALPAPTPGTTTVTLRECGGAKEKRIADTKDSWTLTCLIISNIFNIVLLLLVFFLCRRRRTQDRIQETPVQSQRQWFLQDDSSVLDETSMNQDTHQMTPVIMKPDCPLINSTPADTSRNGQTTGNRVRSQ